jgi:hypothetical protein
MVELAVILPSFFDPRKPKISRVVRKPRTNFIKIKRGLPLPASSSPNFPFAMKTNLKVSECSGL